MGRFANKTLFIVKKAETHCLTYFFLQIHKKFDKSRYLWYSLSQIKKARRYRKWEILFSHLPVLPPKAPAQTVSRRGPSILLERAVFNGQIMRVTA